jgi:Zn-dependent peptidase ImmA (M78 family)/transcriptional regulator with XRE-family HTH domain
MNFSFDFALSRTVNGERVRQSREIAALTQSELARKVDVSQAMIAHIENGLKQPSVELAEAIARETKCGVDFLQRPSGPSLPEGTLLFRAAASASAKALTQARRMAECTLEMYLGMANDFDLPPVGLCPVQGSPASAAAAARDMMGLPPDRPIPHLVRNFEKAGGIVITIPRLPGREAFAVWANDRPIVGLLPGSFGDRLRFSFAHEIGHLLMHVGPTSQRQAERDAHKFAAELLMPETAMRFDFHRGTDLNSLAALKLKWGVSISALVMRAKELNILTRRQVDALMKQISVLGWRTREPENLDLPVERPRAFRQMAEHIYGTDLDFAQMSADYSLPVSFIRDVMDGCASSRETTNIGRGGATVINIREFGSGGTIPGRLSS